MNKVKIFVLSIFLFSPIWALIEALRTRSILFKKWILILFTTVFGSIIILDPAYDGYRHQENVYLHYISLSYSDFFNQSVNILKFEPDQGVAGDLYIHVISFFSASILYFPEFFFILVAFIYGFFYSGSIFKLYSLVSDRNRGFLFIFFMITFVSWKNIEGINTVRTWTGLWVLFYGLIHFFSTKNYKYLFFVLVTPLIHFGYFLISIPVWIVISFGHRPYFYSILFFISFFFSFFTIDIVNQQLQNNKWASTKVRSYSIEENSTVIEKLESNADKNWYWRLVKSGTQHMAINIILFLFIFTGIYFSSLSFVEERLLSIGLVMKIFSNFVWFIGAVSSRSAIISGLFVLGALVLFLSRNGSNIYSKNKKNLIFKILLFVVLLLSPFLFYQVAALIRFFSFYLIFLPFIPWFFEDTNISIRNFLGLILGDR